MLEDTVDNIKYESYESDGLFYDVMIFAFISGWRFLVKTLKCFISYLTVLFNIVSNFGIFAELSKRWRALNRISFRHGTMQAHIGAKKQCYFRLFHQDRKSKPMQLSSCWAIINNDNISVDRLLKPFHIKQMSPCHFYSTRNSEWFLWGSPAATEVHFQMIFPCSAGPLSG